MNIFRTNRNTRQLVFFTRITSLVLSCVGAFLAQKVLQHKTDQSMTLNFALRGKRLVAANIIGTLSNLQRVDQCIVQCMTNSKCRSVNYNKKIKVCQLLDENIDESEIGKTTVKDEDWNFYGYKRQERDFECVEVGGVNRCCYANGIVCTLVKSCKQLKLRCPLCKSGFYRIHLNSENIDVYCDMEDEHGGGGWMMIANVTVENEEDRFNKFIEKVRNDDLNALKNVTYGGFALSEPTVRTIRNTFTEIRMKCHKPSHGRTIDVVFNNTQIIDSVLLNSVSNEEKQPCQNTDYYLLPTDNSILGQHSCVVTGTRYDIVTAKLYNHGYFRYSLGHLHIHEPNRMDCDDFPLGSNQPRDFTGNWQYFLR
ncbi:uncharacterized protein [Clytia hemisphaerica]|uniref:Apple domain-containing protein n=1 Tax=Clytia hemisphaerica TaxID=252671 RepID=A0A7M5X9T1_9CNID